MLEMGATKMNFSKKASDLR